ncbi:hypothetical protein [Kribbella sp. NPDC051770]|uniref:hypothetical protein n=1 Tax=Kribbella sp. NPDC051770 TaxID=3155413 RepID=UPI00344221E9
MNLTDLREELSHRAETVESPDLLAGVHRRIRTTKRRRVAGSLTAVAAIVALGIAVAPTLTSTAPDPADDTPADYVKDSVRISGVVGTDKLDKAWVGNIGETRGSFSWTPTTRNVIIHPYCAANAGETRYLVQIGGRNAASGPCSVDRITPDDSGLIRPDSALWLDVPLNQATTVNVRLVDNDDKLIADDYAQVGIGIYRAGERTPPPGAATAPPEPGPGDHEENGLRFRAEIGGDRLISWASGKPGVSKLTGSYTSTGRPIQIDTFCTANDTGSGFPYDFKVWINGVERLSSCLAMSTDLGTNGGGGFAGVGKPGERMNVTATLVDKSGRPVEVPGARIAFTVYEKGPQRTVDGMSLDERVEFGGAKYQLTELKTVDATTTRKIELKTPEGVPFLVSYGSSDLGAKGVVNGTLDGLSGQSMLSTDDGTSEITSWGLGTDGNWAGPSRTAVLRITDGKVTKGKLILALYTPAK